MAAKTMWGELGNLEKVKTPAAVLREQANLLTEATGHILEGDVTVGRGPFVAWVFQASLDIVAPALNEYRYSVLEASYPMGIYPVHIRDRVHDKEYECADEKEFLARLESILSSSELRTVIATLLSESRT